MRELAGTGCESCREALTGGRAACGAYAHAAGFYSRNLERTRYPGKAFPDSVRLNFLEEKPAA